MTCPICGEIPEHDLVVHVCLTHTDADLLVPAYRCFCYRWFLRSEFMQEHWDAEGGLEVHVMHVTLGDD